MYKGFNKIPDFKNIYSTFKAEPVIEKALESAPEDAVFVYVGVGDKSLWVASIILWENL